MTEARQEDRHWATLQQGLAPGAVLVTDSGETPWGQVALTREHIVFADSTELEGRDSGPGPHALVLMALGACTAITLRMYAARKGWSIDRVGVTLNFVKPEPGAPKPEKEVISRAIMLDGPLDADQREKLFAIAERCPVHRLLTTGAAIRSELIGA